MSSANTKTVDFQIDTFLRNARKLMVDSIAAEIKKAEINGDAELHELYAQRYSDILASELKIVKYTTSPAYVHNKRNTPIHPVKIRDTKLQLKNISNSNNYRKFCVAIASKMGYNEDFSDSPFANCPKTNRVFEYQKLILHFFLLIQ